MKGESKAIQRAGDTPIVKSDLTRDLQKLGVRPAMTLLVHSSLSCLGWVCGGAVTVIQAIETALTESGTLVVPTHSSDLSPPEHWSNPPVPSSWWPTIRETMPAYDCDLTPTRMMGSVAETYRKRHGVIRSRHPQVSFAACGPTSQQITKNHTLDNGLGEGSPLSRLYDLEGWILLLGVGHGQNTSLHLAEHRATYSSKSTIQTGAPLLRDGQRQWVTFMDLESDTSDFEQVGAAFAEETGLVRQGLVGRSNARLMPQRALVDFASQWFTDHR